MSNMKKCSKCGYEAKATVGEIVKKGSIDVCFTCLDKEEEEESPSPALSKREPVTPVSSASVRSAPSAANRSISSAPASPAGGVDPSVKTFLKENLPKHPAFKKLSTDVESAANLQTLTSDRLKKVEKDLGEHKDQSVRIIKELQDQLEAMKLRTEKLEKRGGGGQVKIVRMRDIDLANVPHGVCQLCHNDMQKHPFCGETGTKHIDAKTCQRRLLEGREEFDFGGLERTLVELDYVLHLYLFWDVYDCSPSVRDEARKWLQVQQVRLLQPFDLSPRQGAEARGCNELPACLQRVCTTRVKQQGW